MSVVYPNLIFFYGWNILDTRIRILPPNLNLEDFQYTFRTSQ